MVDWWLILKETIIPMLVSLGAVGIYLKFFYEKKLRAYELKLSKYHEIASPISRVYGGDKSDESMKEFAQKLNELYFFASEDVTKELLKLDKKIRTGKQPYTQDLQGLIIAIRKDLNLGTKNLENEKDFCMFHAGK